MHSDPRLWAALAVGPVFWLLLPLTGVAPGDPSWVLRQPGVFLSVALLYPLAEEVVFRGLVQEGLAARLPTRSLGPVSAANLATSALFSALHAFTHPPLWAAAVFVPSLVFGYFKDRHGKLAAPVTLHAFYNAGYFGLFGSG